MSFWTGSVLLPLPTPGGCKHPLAGDLIPSTSASTIMSSSLALISCFPLERILVMTRVRPDNPESSPLGFMCMYVLSHFSHA